MTGDYRAGEFILLVFAKGQDRPCGKIRLPDLTLAEAQQLVGLDPSNPMYDSYPVASAKVLRALQVYASEPLDRGRLDYFLERESEKPQAV